MGLSKYKFNAGEPFPAENANSIDPASIPAQSAGYLTGGSSPSALAVFQSLGAGADNGKAKINIDGTVYDNVAIPMKKYDISASSSASKSLTVSGQQPYPYGVFFKPDGLKMYLVGSNPSNIHQYTLTVAFDLSTASYASKTFSTTGQGGGATEVAFNNDGTKMYVYSSNNGYIYQYTLSTAWDITTASYASKSFNSGYSLQGFSFKTDGTKMYYVNNNTDLVYQYSLTTAWDISTAVSDSKTFSPASQDTSAQSVKFILSGTVMMINGATTGNIYQYTLSTPWDISTAVYASKSYSIGTNKFDVCFSDDLKYFFITQQQDKVYQYNFASALSSMADVATTVQTAIRNLTGKLETVAYATDHFVVSSATAGLSSKVLRFMTPTTGTDVSGAGATPYLALASQATETAGVGVEFYLVRLDANGKIVGSLLNGANGVGLVGLEGSTSFITIPSDNLKTSADTAQTTTGLTVVKKKEISFLDCSGTLRIKFGLRTPNGVGSAVGQIYKNGVAVGTSQSTPLSSVQTYSQDIAFTKGDLIQLYVNSTNASGTAEVSNFRIYYDKQPNPISNSVITN